MKQMGEREVRTVSTYVITGGTTGIGAAVRKTLLDQGHEVFNIDYKGGDYLADLSTKEGRQGAIEAVFEKYPDGIDVLICNAGVGPTAQDDICPDLLCQHSIGRRLKTIT